VKVEFDTVSLFRLGLISDTNIFLEEDMSTQKRMLLKIVIYNLNSKLSLNTFIFPKFITFKVVSSTSIRVRESELTYYDTKN
jgi:hypothetical protein